jgi:hypothetical protein
MGTTSRQREASNYTSSLPGRACESERNRGFQAVGVAVSKLATSIVRKRGGGILVRLKTEWTAIIGADWAAVTWPSGLGRDGALKLHTAPMAALELQHRAPFLIDRINIFFGRPVVTRLVLVQGPLPHDSPPSSAPARSLVAGEVDALDERISGIADRELRAALARRGRNVIGRRP